MVFNSNQINQMMSGQQAMFANHAAYAHNIGAQAGFGGVPQGLQSANFGAAAAPGGFGSAAVGAMGTAIPGAMTGVALAGGLGLMGKAGGWLDPFTGVGRSFMGGASAAGGLSGGVGALGAGLRAAALPALGYYAAYKGASFLGEQLYQGAQNIGQVGGMVQQYMGPQYGEAGARPGGQAARATIQNMTSILHEVAGENTGNSMKEMMQVMDRAGRFGMLTGIQSAEQFKQKFRTIVDRAKTVATIMGTTIEEAMPALQGFNQMGLWSSQDIMGAGLAMKQVGPGAAGALQGTMMAGAQRSHAMGGSLAAGAALGRNQFLNVSAAMRTGALSEQMLMEYTGGVGGAEGQQMLANRLTGAMQSMTQTPMGRLTMAGLGEVRDGEFTGRIDPKKLAAFQKGEITVGQLQQMGQKSARTREGAASFTYRQEQIGQELMAQGGMELVGSMFQQGLKKAGFLGSSESIQGLMLQKMYGLNRRDAQMMQKFLKDLPGIQERRSRKELAVLKDTMQAAEERQNRSFQGFKDVMSSAFEETLERPIQEFSERLSTSLSERYDNLKDQLSGRVRQINVSQQEEMRRMLADTSRGTPGGRTQRLIAMEQYEQSALQTMYGDTTMTQRMRNEGVIAGGVGAALAGLGLETGQGTRAELLMRSGGRAQTGTGGAGDIQISTIGAGTFMAGADVASITERIRMRGGQADMDAMFKKGSSSKNALQKVKNAYMAMTGNARTLAELDKAKKEMSPADYMEFVRKKLESQPGVKEAMATLKETSTQPGATVESAALDAIAVVQSEADYQKSGAEIDFTKIAAESGASLEALLSDGEDFSREIGRRTGNILKQVKGDPLLGKTATRMLGGALSGIPGVGAVAGLALQGAGELGLFEKDVGFTEQSLQDFLTSGPAGEQLEQYLTKGGDLRDYKELFAARSGNEQLRTFLNAVGGMSEEERSALGQSIKQGGGVGGMINARTMVRRMKERVGAAGEELGALGEEGPEGLRNVLTMMKGAGKGTLAQRARQFEASKTAAQEYAMRVAGSRDASGQIKALRATGGAVAEHIADLAEIERLDVTGMSGAKAKGRLMERGLADELDTGMAGLPEKDRKQLKAIMESKEITKEQADYLKKTLKEVERKVGLEESRTGREEVQRRFNNSLTSFVGANSEFVLAVAQAVPKLAEVEGTKVSEAMKKISQNNATE